MYISSFNIEEFGIFSNIRVDSISPGICIMFGANGAGKTTCMNFLLFMLYGQIKKQKFKQVNKFRGNITLSFSSSINKKININRNFSDQFYTITDENDIRLDNALFEKNFFGDKNFCKNITTIDISSFTNLDIELADHTAIDNNSHNIITQKTPINLQNHIKSLIKSSQEHDKILNSIQDKINVLELVNNKITNISKNADKWNRYRKNIINSESVLSQLNTEKILLKKEKRELIHQIASWSHWNEWRAVNKRLEKMLPVKGNFPENGIEQLLKIEESIETFTRKISEIKDRILFLDTKRSSFAIDEALLVELPNLRKISELKAGYKNAITALPVNDNNLKKAEQDLDNSLLQLGPGWTCERIISLDRSLFVREEIEKQERERNTAILAHRAAMDNLENINKEHETNSRLLENAKIQLQELPVPEAIMDDAERDELRQNMARLAENRRLEPGRKKNIESSEIIFKRACEQAHIHFPSLLGNSEEIHNKIRNIFSDLLSRQQEALDLAEKIHNTLEKSKEADLILKQAEDKAENIRKKIEDKRATQQNTISNRDSIGSRLVSIRSLHSLDSSINTAKEKLAEIETRIKEEKSPASIKHWSMLIVGSIFLGVGCGIFTACQFFGLTELSITDDIIIPINLWSSYASLVCGVILLAFGMSINTPEKIRHKEILDNLLLSRKNISLHLLELKNQAQKICSELTISDMDPVTLEAEEMLLEREKEQFFHHERSIVEIDELKQELAQLRIEIAKYKNNAQEINNKVQQYRRRWHAFMEGLNVDIVQLPENAETFFARVESARIAYENVINSKKELDELWEDLHMVEKAILAMPAITDRIQASTGEFSLEEAVNKTLAECREADQAKELKIKIQTEISLREKELTKLHSLQEDASAKLHEMSRQLEGANHNWNNLLQSIGLEINLEPHTVHEAYKCMDDCLAAKNNKESLLNERIKLADDIDSFINQIKNVLSRLPTYDRDFFPQEIDWLNFFDELLSKAEENEINNNEKNNLIKQIEECNLQLISFENERSLALAREKELFEKAGVTNKDDFVKIGHENEERTKLCHIISNLESILAIESGDIPLDKYLATFDIGDRQSREKRLDEIEQFLKNIILRIKQEKAKLKDYELQISSLDDFDELFRLRQKSSLLEQEIKNIKYNYAVKLVSQQMLKKAYENYEEKFQPEFIKNAALILSNITLGNLHGLHTSIENNKIYLSSSSGNNLEPTELSKAEQEQTALALKLSCLSKFSENRESIPIFMDELIVNFDPERMETAAEMIAHAAHPNQDSQQIFYFTCQPRIVELLREKDPEAVLFNIKDGKIHVEKVS